MLLLSTWPGWTEQSSPVVLELFTSQGCSSCPPADDLLSRMGRSPELQGQIIPLAYHVDYWNYLGWTDPFSQKSWTTRQNDYAAKFRRSNIYTPQLVVNGRDECLGSDYPAILSKIRSAGATHPASRVQLEKGKYNPALRQLQITLTAEVLKEGMAKELHLMLAVFENGLSTQVPRGENSGKTLPNDYVVRTLELVLTIPEKSGHQSRKELVVILEPGWNPAKTGVAAFLQDPESLEIYSAAVLAKILVQ